MLYRVLIVFCLSVTPSFADNAEANVIQWLKNMSQAMKTLDYQGTIVFFKNDRLDTMKYSHIVNNGYEQERLLSLNSPMREVIREAGKVRCKFKKTNEVVLNHRPVSNSFIMDLPSDFSTLSLAYQLTVLNDESVAMHPAYVVSIKPKDQYRYKRKVWIDKQYFLPLKMEVYDVSGRTVQQVLFTDIHVGKQSSFTFVESETKEEKTRHLHQANLLPISQAGFTLGALPLNFKVVFFTRIKNDSGVPVEHVLLSDGFSLVSIYREPKAKDTQEGLQTLGSVKSFTQLINGSQLTVMGEVPAKTVQFIAQGVKLKK